MNTLSRIGGVLGRILQGSDAAEMVVAADGPSGRLHVPNDGDGRFEIQRVQGRAVLTPDASSYYLYAVLPADLLARAGGEAWVEVEYFGDRHGLFRVQYASTDRAAEHDGLYKPAEQRFIPGDAGLRRFRRALFRLPDFDPARTQNLGASFRLEFRSELLVSRIAVTLGRPEDAALFTAMAPLPDLKKLPGRFYPINYLFIEITNACNFKCTWCPDDIMDRRRGFMKKEKVFRVLDEIASKRAWLGPLYPVKLHQMGEPMLHPELPAIVEYAESRGVAIELNTNCGLITEENIDALYRGGLTNLILSYQTPDVASFKTRKAPRIGFDEYRDKVRLAVERKVALGARTHVEIDIMNTKYADGYRIVSEDEQAAAFLEDWIAFAAELERRYGLAPRAHDRERIRSFHFLDQDENGSRYEILEGVHLIWKRCHSWGNVIDTAGASGTFDPSGKALPMKGEATAASGDGFISAEHPRASGGASEPGGLGGVAQHPPAQRGTYCPAPYDQFVIQWNGDVVSCCTDYEGRTKTANVFASSIEEVWKSATLTRRKQDMLEGRLLDVCAKCMGIG